MNYGDQAPADPNISHTSYPSSPPSLEESQQLGSASTSTALPRFTPVKLRIKFAGPLPDSVPEVMSNIVAPYGGDDDSGDESFQFSGVNAKAVRSQMDVDASNESDAHTNEEPEETPKKELRPKRNADSSSSGSKKGGRKSKGRKAKTAKKIKEEPKEDGNDDGDEDDEIYEVDRILEHGLSDDGQVLYKVKWVGYGPEFDSYEPESMLSSAKQRIEEYKRSLPVETRVELEASLGKKKKGRPSKGGKRPRADSPALPSDESAAEDKDEDEDFDFDQAAASSSKRAGSSITRSRGRPSKNKAELKLFESPKPTGPPKKKAFLQARQGWLDESDSDSDRGSETKKEKRVEKAAEQKSESPAPPARKRGGRAVEETPSTVNGRAGSSRAAAAAAAAVAAVVEGMYRHENGEVDVVLTEGRAQRVVSLREAHDIAGFGLVQFLADRFHFQA